MPWSNGKFVHNPDLAPVLERSIVVEKIKREREPENDIEGTPEALARRIAVLKEGNDALEAGGRDRGSIPPSSPCPPEPLTAERAATIGRIIQERSLLGAFGVTPGELAEFVRLAKKGASK